MLKKLASPVPLSKKHRAALNACFGPGDHFFVNEPGTHLTHWDDQFKLPDEAEALAMQQQGFENHLNAHAKALLATARDIGTCTPEYEAAVEAERTNKAQRSVNWPQPEKGTR